MVSLAANDQRRSRLGEGERAPAGLRRAARGQLEMSIERLEGDTDEDLGTAVHETRKGLKRLRAAVRLGRDELGEEAYRHENGAFRDAGRRLGGARDGRVLLETFDALADRYPDEAPPERFEGFKRTLVGQGGAAQRRLHERAAIDEVLGELRRACARVGDWPLERKGLETLAGLGAHVPRRPPRVPQRPSGAEHREPARAARRVKCLWYAAQIVRSAAPKKMKRTARRAHELSNLIGEDHDLALLAERTDERHDRFAEGTTAGELAALTERRRAELRREALDLGQRLFRKKPRKVARPLEKSGAA